ncbi:unnamed protein product [Brassica oleracea]
MGVTRGTSETSGINGWFANEDMEQQHNEDVDEAETSVKRRLVSNTVIEERKLCEGNLQEVRLVIVLLHMNHEGQVLVKRNLEDGGSTADRPPYLRIQHADSVEGSVVDRDGDEVNDDSAGPSKRTRGSEVQETCLPFYGRDLSVGGPSHSVEAENERECSPITVLQCDCVSGFEASKEEVTHTWNESPLNAGFALPGSSYTANGQGPPNGDSNDEIVEFDPIKYHNCYCPWVNENVAAAGCSLDSSSSSSVAEALCGWQLTLDALDSF